MRKILIRAGILVLAVVAVLLAVMYLVPELENTDRIKVNNSSDWMTGVPGNMLLSQINIPGTHDSATSHVQLPYFSKCQNDDIKTQLENGYRYLDIRLGIESKKSESSLVLMHGFTNCRYGFWPWSGKLKFTSVLTDCCEFLKEHPTETVILAIKQEHGNESVAEFQECLNREMEKLQSYFLFTDEMPTLDEARGKIVVFRRYEDEAHYGEKAGLPLIWEDQGGSEVPEACLAENDNRLYTVKVQDRYEFNTKVKWNLFKTAAEAISAGDKTDVCINFLSTKGTKKYGHPYGYARKLNTLFMSNDYSAPSGWTIVDYGTAKIAKKIYSSNPASLFAGVSLVTKNAGGNFEPRFEIRPKEEFVVEPENKEEKIYSFLQGPIAWESKADWSGDWCEYYYGRQKFGAFGCGMCCMANVYDTLSGNEGSPLDAFEYAKTIGYAPTKKAAAIGWGALKIALRGMGMDCDLYYKPEEYSDFQDQMENCESMIVLITSSEDNTFWKDTSGHYVNIWLYDRETDTVFLAEPGEPEKNRSRVPLKYVYDALKTVSKYQYIRIDGYDAEKDQWKPQGINCQWTQPKYYEAKKSSE